MLNIILLAASSISYELSSWMSDLGDSIGSRMLYQVDLPGAHHAGYLKTRIWLPFISRYAVCQTETITSLLNNGVRWLDIRVGENEGELWFAHTLRSKQKVYDGINEVRSWIESNSEIVILDLNVDFGYKAKSRETAETNLLIGKLEQIFGDMIMSSDDFSSKTVQHLVSSNKRVLLTGSLASKYQVPQQNSWGITNESNWRKLVDKIVNWIETEGSSAIGSGMLAVSSAAVTPDLRKGLSPPRWVTRKASNSLRSRIPAIKIRLGVVSTDYVRIDTTRTIIDHNTMV